MLFPILLQVGFVFIGGQAGRLLDVQQIKSQFPRIVSGFAIGFLAGGVVAIPLLRLPGGANGLLLIAAIAQVAFVLLLTTTANRFVEHLGQVESAPRGVSRPPLHQLLSSRFVVLLMAYQVLSAAGTYMAEYILFDRAVAQFGSADSLAQFLSRFTIALNAVNLVFLALLAGPLLRRFGLRLGIVANPAVVMLLAAAMLVSATRAGAGSLVLFALVGVRSDRRRRADRRRHQGIARRDVPGAAVEDRLAIQSMVEGAGLPLAIGVTGVVLFALRTAGASVAVIIGVTVAVCVAWTVAAILLYRNYARALVEALGPRLLRDAPVDAENAATAAFLHDLLASDDGRAVRLALDLLPSAGEESGQHAELALLADDPRPDVRLRALVWLAEAGTVRPAYASVGRCESSSTIRIRPRGRGAGGDRARGRRARRRGGGSARNSGHHECAVAFSDASATRRCLESPLRWRAGRAGVAPGTRLVRATRLVRPSRPPRASAHR